MRKPGNTNDRAKAIVSDCIKKIAEENISHKNWCEYAVENYKITTRRAEQVWSIAWGDIRQQFAVDAEQNLQQAVIRLDALYIEARKSGYDYNTQVNILKEKNRLMGLGKEVHEVRSDIKLSFGFSEEEEREES